MIIFGFYIDYAMMVSLILIERSQKLIQKHDCNGRSQQNGFIKNNSPFFLSDPGGTASKQQDFDPYRSSGKQIDYEGLSNYDPFKIYDNKLPRTRDSQIQQVGFLLALVFSFEQVYFNKCICIFDSLFWTLHYFSFAISLEWSSSFPGHWTPIFHVSKIWALRNNHKNSITFTFLVLSLLHSLYSGFSILFLQTVHLSLWILHLNGFI